MMLRPYLYDETSGLPGTSAKTASMQIYPNPAKDLIFFEIPADTEGNKIQLEIYDASGRLMSLSNPHTNSLDISSYPAGIYYIRALVGKSVYHSEFRINP